ncbi:unnamed protein product [Ilex paraguariensis]|uniref:Protein phosphatase n=1 Tax=Ilex paraguariensis TaxID=185542 RepID=A0ABC8UU57_9AQUA
MKGSRSAVWAFPKVGNTTDSPSSAEELEVLVEAGHPIVPKTDGLFDNVHAAKIEHIEDLCLREGDMPELLAWTMAKVARLKSLDKCTSSSFAMAAHDAGVEHRGGKYDDIAMVVAYILSADCSLHSKDSLGEIDNNEVGDDASSDPKEASVTAYKMSNWRNEKKATSKRMNTGISWRNGYFLGESSRKWKKCGNSTQKVHGKLQLKQNLFNTG